MANIGSKENMYKDDENLSFEFHIDFDFLEEVVAERRDYFDEIN